MSDDSIASTSRRTILKATGAVGFGTVGIATLSGTARANCPCTTVTLGKLDTGEINSLEEGTTSSFTLTLDGDLRIADDCGACQGDKDVTVQVTPTAFKDGGSEVTEVRLEIDDDNGACKCADDGLYLSGATVKAGPETAEYDCGDTENSNQEYSRIPAAAAPVNDKNGKPYGISHIVIDVCVFPNCYVPGETSCANGGGS
jgi:hypothetical protein